MWKKPAVDVLRGASEAQSRGIAAPGVAVAIGNFDGVHRGHQALVRTVVERAPALGVRPAILTFDPHPARLLSPDHAPPLLLAPARKLELLALAGIEIAVLEPFTHALAALSPDAFASDILAGALGARLVCVGWDFTFGKKRAGTPDHLRELGERLGFAVEVVGAVKVAGAVCSSTRIRALIAEGRVEDAAVLLGRPFEIEGAVVRGAGRGRTIGVPTANLTPEAEVLPRTGVYGATVLLEGGRHARAVVNVGTAPTFTGAGHPVTVEAHLLDFPPPGASGDLYGQRARLELRFRLREERRFPSVDALVAQIRDDLAVGAARLGALEEP